MPEKTPLEILLEEVTKLMTQLREYENSPLAEIPEDIEKRLEELENLAELMSKLNTDTFARLGLDEEQLKTLRISLVELPMKERRLLERVQKLQQEAEAERRNSTIGKMVEKQKKKVQDPSERKKKFDRFGGKKDWRPL